MKLFISLRNEIIFFRLIHEEEINNHLQYNCKKILLDLVIDIRKQL